MFARSLLPTLLASALLLPALACDKAEEKKEDKAPEKTDEEKLAEERVAKKRAEREAKEKADKEAAEAKAKTLDEICVLPDPKEMPKNLEKACKAVAQANDDFMNRLYEGDAVTRWNEAKGTQLPMTEGQCTTTGSIEVAACQVNALNQAPSELRKKLPDLLKACMEKFGGDAPAGE